MSPVRSETFACHLAMGPDSVAARPLTRTTVVFAAFAVPVNSISGESETCQPLRLAKRMSTVRLPGIWDRINALRLAANALIRSRSAAGK